MPGCPFGLQYSWANVETASPGQEWPGLRVISSKNYISCFLVHSDGLYIFELSARETNLMKKRIVFLLMDDLTIFSYLDSVACGIHGLITDEKIEVFDTSR